MIISKKNRFVFIKTPKTAGSSLELYLSQFCGSNDIITPLLPNEEKIKKKLKILTAQNYILEKFTLRYLKEFRFKHKFILSDHISLKFIERHIDINLKKYFIFTVVRNPYDWIVSGFCWYILNNNIIDRKNIKNLNKVEINIIFKLFLSLECHSFFSTIKNMIMSKKLNIQVYKFENLKIR